MTSDDQRWLRERLLLVEHLRTEGIHDERVLGALARVPRHEFVEGAEGAYEDRALPISGGQTISQPYMVAYMTQALQPGPTMRVLEVGTGSGYQTAVLAELCAEVWTIERLQELSDRARLRLGSLGYANVHFAVGDGTLGLREQAPFDRILGTAALPAIPPPWEEQLAEGGRIIAPVGERWRQALMLATKVQGRLRQSPDIPCIFVPMIGEYGFKE